MGSLSSATRLLTASTCSPGTPLRCVLWRKCGIRGWQELAVGQFPLWRDGHLPSVPSPPLLHLSSSISSYVCFPPCFIMESFQTYAESRGSGRSKPHKPAPSFHGCPCRALLVHSTSLPVCLCAPWAPSTSHLPSIFLSCSPRWLLEGGGYVLSLFPTCVFFVF